MEYVNKMIAAYKKAVLENYINFNGRTKLADYWWFFAANFIIALVLSILDRILISVLGFAILGTIYSLATLLPSIGAAIRRMHDIGKCGWWILAPLYNIYLLIQPSDAKNQYGDVEK